MEAAAVNPFDWKIIDGILSPGRPHVFPLVVGVDGAGVVDAVGERVRRFHLGDRVFGQFLHDPVGVGTYAEVSTVPEGIGVASTPPQLDSLRAAALPTAGMTALLAVETIDPKVGSRVLVVGASGGVGSFALQLLHVRGVHVTAAVRGGDLDAVRRGGADEVIDTTSQELSAVAAVSHPDGFDALLDLASDRVRFAEVARRVRRGGVAATTTYSADVEGLGMMGIRGVNLDLQPNSALLSRLADEVVAGRVEVPAITRISLADAPGALAESRAGRLRGKVVIGLP
jgi:NADPH2:quinone reductase